MRNSAFLQEILDKNPEEYYTCNTRLWGLRMFSIRLDKNIERSLNELAALTQETKSAMIREAILQYIEDKLDYIAAVRALNDAKRQKTIPLEDVLAEFKDGL